MPNNQAEPATSDNEEIISYQKLRAFIGFIGLFLPIAVVVGCYVFGAKQYSFQPSISHYYYSIMHIVFVCTLCVLGGFLITYKGKSLWESRVSNLAGYCAFGVASFPTRFSGFRPGNGSANQYITILIDITKFWGGVHFVFATTLFVCFVLFCLVFFQQPDKKYSGIDELKFRKRKRIYKVCGVGILTSIILIALFKFFIPQKGLLIYSTLIFETTSLWFFGIAWLIKGSLSLTKIPIVKKIIKPIR